MSPGPAQLRVGDLTQSGDERVTGHELSADGKTCITLYEPTTLAENFTFYKSSNDYSGHSSGSNSRSQVTPLLLRLIKPIIKNLLQLYKKNG